MWVFYSCKLILKELVTTIIITSSIFVSKQFLSYLKVLTPYVICIHALWLDDGNLN